MSKTKILRISSALTLAITLLITSAIMLGQAHASTDDAFPSNWISDSVIALQVEDLTQQDGRKCLLQSQTSTIRTPESWSK